MASHYEYFGSGTHMSAVLKADVRRARRAHPERFARKRVELKEFDENGQVKVVGVTYESAAAPMSPTRRHTLSLQKERY